MPEAQPIELRTVEVQELTQKTDQLLEKYSDFEVVDESDYCHGAIDLKAIKGMQQKIEEERFKITRPMDTAKKAVLNFFRPFELRLDSMEKNIKSKLLGWKDKEDARIAEEQRKENERAEREANRLREEARKADELAAEKERKRLAEEQRKADERAEAERKRIAKEQAEAKSNEDKRRADEQAEAEGKRREKEQDRLHQERLDAEAEQRERTARAENLEERAETKQAAPLAPAAPKVTGISTSKKWLFQITDPSKVPDQYKTIDEKKIGGVVRALKGDTDIPGVRVWQESTMAARSA